MKKYPKQASEHTKWNQKSFEKMATEQGLYEKLVMILWKESEDSKGREKTNKYKFQWQSATSRRLSDLDYEWLEENFRTHEPGFHTTSSKQIMGDVTKTYQIFGVPIDNAKTTRKVQFNPEAPVIKYHLKSYNSCCLSSLVSAFHCIGYYRAVPSIVIRIKE